MIDLPLDRIGNAVYILTLLLAALCLARGHRQKHINLWDLVTATDRAGHRRTDGRKLFEVGAFFVMTITFYFLTVTGKMSEWYALIYAAAWVTARTFRDLVQLKQQQIAGVKNGNPG